MYRHHGHNFHEMDFQGYHYYILGKMHTSLQLVVKFNNLAKKNKSKTRMLTNSVWFGGLNVHVASLLYEVRIHLRERVHQRHVLLFHKHRRINTTDQGFYSSQPSLDEGQIRVISINLLRVHYCHCIGNDCSPISTLDDVSSVSKTIH